MNEPERVAAYEAQNGGQARSLTPKQRRRVIHKSGRSARRFAERLALADEVVAAMRALSDAGVDLDHGDPYRVTVPDHDFPTMPECEHTNHCERCGAVDDEPCRTPKGKTTNTHAIRTAA